jgi:hypothetical protein
MIHWLSRTTLATLLFASAPSFAVADDEAQRAADAFRAHVQPLMEKFCVKCHSGEEPKGELAMAAFLERASVAEDRETWDKIVEKLRAGEMPPEDESQPTDSQRRQMIEWIDAGLARSDCGSQPRDPGRVTLRRLNRNEYNNTIRDLVGIDFHPADDFPSDDVGYGFDNIGDVLSMPPILLEKYLAAADDITRRALGTDLVGLTTGEIEGGQLLDGGVRFLTSQGDVSNKTRLHGEGLYILRVKAWGDQAGDEPVKMGLHFDDKLVRTVEVKAVKDYPQTYEAWITTKGGRHRVAASFLNDYYQPGQPAPNDRNLAVIGLELMGPYPAPYKQVVLREHTPEDRPALAREIVGTFMARAFRRPSTDAEIDRVMQLVELATAEGESFAGSIAVAVQAMLVSPHFLFRVELDPEGDDPHAVRVLNDFELATRLSYFLWSSMPDEELFALARQGVLGERLEAQVRRMLADPKSRALVEHFAGQWLQLRNLDTSKPDNDVYPGFDDALRRAMRTETEQFFAAILREDRSVLEFIDADFTFVNERLAKHYGIPDVKGNEFRRVSVDRERRGGVLGQASVLTVTSNPTRTSPVKRGKWVLDNLLGTPPPPPPADVPPLAEEGEVLTGSLRERMEQHRSKAICASCHKSMDPLGFGLENYDGIGAWRENDGKFEIDASGTLPGGESFAGPRELKEILKARKDDFVRCLAEKLLTYGLGRGVEYSDRCTVEDIAQVAKEHDYKFSSLVLAIVQSDAFGKRKAKGSKP